MFCKERDCLFGLCGLFERIRLADIKNQRAVIRDIADYFFELFIRILVERIDSHILDEYTGVAAHHRKSLDRLLDIFKGTRRAVEEMIIEIRKIGTDGFILELRGIEFLEIALRSEKQERAADISVSYKRLYIFFVDSSHSVHPFRQNSARREHRNSDIPLPSGRICVRAEGQQFAHDRRRSVGIRR